MLTESWGNKGMIRNLLVINLSSHGLKNFGGEPLSKFYYISKGNKYNYQKVTLFILKTKMRTISYNANGKDITGEIKHI